MHAAPALRDKLRPVFLRAFASAKGAESVRKTELLQFSQDETGGAMCQRHSDTQDGIYYIIAKWGGRSSVD